MDQEGTRHTDDGKASQAGSSSIACAAVSFALMAGAWLLVSGAEQECSMTALGGYVLAFPCAGIGWIVALVGLALGIRACRRSQVRAGVVAIILNVVLLLAPVVGIAVIEG